MKLFLTQHPWQAGLLVAVLAFVLNTARRIATGYGRMPKEKKLELNMRRAAMGLRKLARAERILHRFIAVRDAAPGRPIPGMVRRLWGATRDASDAERHLSAVLKKAPALGCSISAMQNIERSSGAAKRIRDECRRQVNVRTREGAAPARLTEGQMRSLLLDCVRELEQSKVGVGAWMRETERARAEMTQVVDSVILNSGGILRNPLKQETAVEDGQTQSVLLLRRTENDIGKVNDCLSAVEEALNTLGVAGSRSARELEALAGRALDTIDEALGNAELPLPEDLASGVSPYEPRDGSLRRGSLERIYMLLGQIEASFASTQRDGNAVANMSKGAPASSRDGEWRT